MPTHPCTSCHRELERCAEFGCILQKFKLAFFFSFLSDFVTNSTRYAPFISVFGCVDHHSNFKYFSFLLVLALSLNIRVYAADVLKFRIHLAPIRCIQPVEYTFILLFFVLRDSTTRFSTSSFFHHLNQPRLLTKGLKYFQIWLRIRRVIRILSPKI